jgi:NAD(P)-dependent dehydrogenase (short-subunit alcohol dehydrogenase family)
MTSKNILVVLGSGPGIGVSVASLFAQNGDFDHIVLCARRKAQLDVDAEAVRKAGKAQVTALVVDLADAGSLKTGLHDISKLATLGAVLFNAARVQPSTVLQTSAEELRLDYEVATPLQSDASDCFGQISVVASHEVSKWCLPLLSSSPKAGSFLVTNSKLYIEPFPVACHLPRRRNGAWCCP